MVHYCAAGHRFGTGVPAQQQRHDRPALPFLFLPPAWRKLFSGFLPLAFFCKRRRNPLLEPQQDSDGGPGAVLLAPVPP